MQHIDSPEPAPGEATVPEPTDAVWKSERLVQFYLEGVRGALPLAHAQIEVMLDLLQTTGKADFRFLDLGCGDGVLGAAILGTFPAARGVFGDFSQPMLDAARVKLAAFQDRVELQPIDYGKQGWEEPLRASGPFDAVVSGLSIHHQQHNRKQAIYTEIHKLLAPGGWFVNIEHVAPACATTTALFDEALLNGLVRGQQRRGESSDREAVRRRYIDREDKKANILEPVEEQCNWLREIGFEEVDCFFKLYEIAVFGGRKR